MSRGRAAEAFVAQALAKRGLRIVARNWRRIGCEIDIAATRGDSLYVVEVKCCRRLVSDEGTMLSLLRVRKMRALRRGAAMLHSTLGAEVSSIRIDLAVVVPSDFGSFKLQYFPDVGR